MVPSKQQNYSVLDQPQVVNCLFHPRPEGAYRQTSNTRKDLMITVGKNAQVGGSFHFVNKQAPTLLFFHGNGEIVSDYDELGLIFNEAGLNLFVVDYRGYGRSTGMPTVSSMMMDCHDIFEFTQTYRSKENLTGPLCVMGRSLGSASAIELCATRYRDFDCLIIESGFAYASPLLQKLGINPSLIGFKEQQGFENIDKIAVFSNPCLIIHAQFDHIIPFSDGQALFEACGSKDKVLLEIKGANHNDIFLRGMKQYMAHLKKICFQ